MKRKVFLKLSDCFSDKTLDCVMRNEKAMALVTVLILVFVLTILTGIMLTLLSSQVRLIEHDNSRTESRYADEAVMVRELELKRKGLATDPYYDINNIRVGVSYTIGAGLNQTDKLDLSCDYTTIFE